MPITKTEHEIRFADARKPGALSPASLDLVLTSPPYPMIAMWDETFTRLNPAVGIALKNNQGKQAFTLMHAELDQVWAATAKALKEGGLAVINIGDAARTLGGQFTLWPNHARVTMAMLELGLTPLPAIIWRKPTNSPTKFMGSGMLPPGAYVTLEHEMVLIFRKGGLRAFTTPQEKALRRESAYFWHERNQWFSDVWLGLLGQRQDITDKKSRDRSGAFPLELACRLISMFSVKGDMVCDPFLGTGTTMAAAMITGRGSLGFEIDENLSDIIYSKLHSITENSADLASRRLAAQAEFLARRASANKKPPAHKNVIYGLEVVSAQERELRFETIERVEQTAPGRFAVTYKNG